MASLNQLISEIAHAVGDPNNIPLRRNIRYAILHTRNELIRKSYEAHHFIDKPVRLTNGLPFQSVRTTGVNNNEIAFAKEGTAQFYHNLAGFCNQPIYDYINGYIYFFGNANWFSGIYSIIIESPFEAPQIIPEETFETSKDINGEIDDESKFDDDEFLLPEDMIGAIKDIIFKRNLLDIPRETNEILMDNIVK